MTTPFLLRQSVRDFRDPNATEAKRNAIRGWWAEQDIPNQFAAMNRAHEIERDAKWLNPASRPTA